MTAETGLDFLRTRTVVDCDTLDERGEYIPLLCPQLSSSVVMLMNAVPQTFGPFQDCTSNQVCLQDRRIQMRASLTKQAIAFGELSKPSNAALVRETLAQARSLSSRFADVGVEDLGVEVAVCYPLPV